MIGSSLCFLREMLLTSDNSVILCTAANTGEVKLRRIIGDLYGNFFPRGGHMFKVSTLYDYLFAIIFTLTLNLLTTTIVAPPSNASKFQMGFNSAFNF